SSTARTSCLRGEVVRSIVTDAPAIVRFCQRLMASLYYTAMKSVVLALVGLALLASSCNRPHQESPVATVTPTATPVSVPPAGFKFEDMVVGTGSRPLFNQVLLIRYTGWLADGRKIDSTEHKPPM